MSRQPILDQPTARALGRKPKLKAVQRMWALSRNGQFLMYTGRQVMLKEYRKYLPSVFKSKAVRVRVTVEEE